MSVHFQVTVDNRQVNAALDRLISIGQHPAAVMKDIATYGENSTRDRFKQQVGPDGLGWIPSMRAKETGTKTLIDTSRLLSSITSQSGNDSAEWGSNAIYAAIHQFGGDINRPAFSKYMRLRTDAKGNLLRQKDHKNLAVFAKDNHKRARTVQSTTQAYTITIPARPYLGINADDEANIVDIVNQHLADAITG